MNSDHPTGKNPSGGTQYDFSESISEILGALSDIKKNLPNGELKALQDRFVDLTDTLDELRNETDTLKETLSDPEDGVIVKLNKNTELVHRLEQYRVDVWEKKMASIAQLESWKESVTKVLWILFAAVVSIIINMVIKSTA